MRRVEQEISCQHVTKTTAAVGDCCMVAAQKGIFLPCVVAMVNDNAGNGFWIVHDDCQHLKGKPSNGASVKETIDRLTLNRSSGVGMVGKWKQQQHQSNNGQWYCVSHSINPFCSSSSSRQVRQEQEREREREEKKT